MEFMTAGIQHTSCDRHDHGGHRYCWQWVADANARERERIDDIINRVSNTAKTLLPCELTDECTAVAVERVVVYARELECSGESVSLRGGAYLGVRLLGRACSNSRPQFGSFASRFISRLPVDTVQLRCIYHKSA